MRFTTANIVGTIALLPGASAARWSCQAADDSSLESMLASLVVGPLVPQHAQPPLRLVASTRLSRFSMTEDHPGVMIRADVARLGADLDAEYDRLVAI